MSILDIIKKKSVSIDPPWLETCVLANKVPNIQFGIPPNKKPKVSTEGNYITYPKNAILLEIQPQKYFKALNSSDNSAIDSDKYLDFECNIATIFDGLHIIHCLLFPNVLGVNLSIDSVPLPVIVKLIKYRPQLFYLPATKSKFKCDERVKFTNFGCLLSIKKAQLLNDESYKGNGLDLKIINTMPCLSQNSDILDLWKDCNIDYGLKDPKLEPSISNLAISDSIRSEKVINSSLKIIDPFGDNCLSTMYWNISFEQQEQIDLLIRTLPGWKESTLLEESIDNSYPTATSISNLTSKLQNDSTSNFSTNQLSNTSQYFGSTPIDPHVFSNPIVLLDEDLEDLALLFSSSF